MAQGDGLDRRTFLARAGALAAATMATRGTFLGDRLPHHAPRARRVVHICLCGGLSHVDSFDHKPLLARLHGKPLPVTDRPDTFFGNVGLLKRPDWEFRQRGESGLWVSDLFPHIAGIADELTVIRSMFAETSNHTPATFQENTGFRLNGFPVLGAWVNHALGSESRDLPGYVVIPDERGLPAGGPIQWTNGFLSAEHQGVVIRSDGTPVADLFPARTIASDAEAATRSLLRTLNNRHLATHDDDVLRARMQAHELADRMQGAVPEATAIETEPGYLRAMYGVDDPACSSFARSCLLARRLLERGVRVVQLFAGGAFGSPRINWDGHEDMRRNHGREAPRIDRPVAALVRDLKQRGLLDDTLVLFTSEFGRTPFAESAADQVGAGRDHNQNGFTVWMAGGGLRTGLAYGATDEFGYRAVENRVHWNDFHATVLHLLGIDHLRLVHYHDGIRRRLTNVGGKVLFDLIS